MHGDDGQRGARGLRLTRLQHQLVTALQDPRALMTATSTELDMTLRLLRRVQLLGRVGSRLQELGLLEMLPAAAQDQFESALVAAEARRRVGLWELNRLAWALDGLPLSGPVVALKGCAYLLAGTPNAAGRMFSDVDLMVAEVDLPAVEARLKQRGWSGKNLTPYDDQYYRVWTHELPPMTHLERGVEVDLHHNILQRTAHLKPNAALLLAAARPVAGTRYHVLAPIDMVLHAIVHLFYGGQMDDALRELADIADLLEHFGKTEPGFWEGFWTRAEALDLARPAYYALRYAEKILGTPVPDSVVGASFGGAPSRAELALMDWMVVRSLYPPPLQRRSLDVLAARQLAYVRSHCVKMPLVMLGRHLSRKFLARRFGPVSPDNGR